MSINVSELEILLQLSNIELFVALYGVAIGGLFAVREYGADEKATVAWWRAAAVLDCFLAVFLILWLIAALMIRLAVMVGLGS